MLGAVKALLADHPAELILLGVEVPILTPADPVTGFTPVGFPNPLPDPTPRLKRIATELGREGIRARVEVAFGGVSDQILERARALDVDLIALNTHGRKGLARMLNGSIAEDVFRHMNRAVLLHRVGTAVEAPAEAPALE